MIVELTYKGFEYRHEYLAGLNCVDFEMPWGMLLLTRVSGDWKFEWVRKMK